ncbi:hypothetical protein [Cellulosimicrobium funkei]|uniref:Uncharacterized protein n=1 Tax=Cellulosimicrobium funkei TaxID=264251 RepID=A0A4Y8QX97_9MICO|nr:hypothetical protein [Cellulosimicrobium funkei]TFF04366.1 hypothetical protein E1O70_18140 [Cellulosimicrobium funkei]TGA67969.1 hypothetical protein EQW79_018650 [Cellulosimicrobium terreum]
MTTTPFHDPHAEPVQPIRIELNGATLDPFAEHTTLDAENGRDVVGRLGTTRSGVARTIATRGLEPR